jgi:hypothetical protein
MYAMTLLPYAGLSAAIPSNKTHVTRWGYQYCVFCNLAFTEKCLHILLMTVIVVNVNIYKTVHDLIARCFSELCGAAPARLRGADRRWT